MPPASGSNPAVEIGYPTPAMVVEVHRFFSFKVSQFGILKKLCPKTDSWRKIKTAIIIVNYRMKTTMTFAR